MKKYLSILILVFLYSRNSQAQYTENFDNYSCVRANMQAACWVFSAFSISTTSGINNCSLRSGALTGINTLVSPIFKSNSNTVNVKFQHKFTDNSSTPQLSFQVEYPNGSSTITPYSVSYASNNTVINNTFSFTPAYPLFKIKLIATGSGGNSRAIIDNITMDGSNLNDVALLGPSTNSCNTPFPLRLLDFEAGFEFNKVVLKWSSSDETLFKGFEVEKSIDALTFEKLAFVNPKSSTEEANYEFMDYNLGQSKTYYYRLKMLDLDGQVQYSSIQSVLIDKPNLEADVLLFPNPLHTEKLNIVNGDYTLEKIIDSNGISIEFSKNRFGEFQIKSSLRQGLYLFIFKDKKGIISSKKVLKM